jgi:4-amino-4-deoxy-L-arabinose transferase-like glycosyltransferase
VNDAATAWRDKFLLAILVLSLGLKVGLAIALDDRGPVLDEGVYLNLARTLADTGQYSNNFRPPLYPAYLALNLWLGWDTLGVRLVQAGLSTLTVILVYRIGRRTLGRAAARIAALLVAFDPVLVMFAHRLWSETLFIVLLFLALDLLTMAVANTRRWPWLVAGLSLGLAGLARPVVLTFVPLLLPWAILQALRHAPAAAWLRGTQRFALLVLTCALVVAPWTIRNVRKTGALIVVDTNGPFNFLVGTQPEAAFVVKDDVWSPRFGTVSGQPYEVAVNKDAGDTQRRALQQALDNVQRRPGLYLRKCIWEAGHLWTLDSFLLRHLRNHWYGSGQPRWLAPVATAASGGFFVLLVLAALLGLTTQQRSPFRGLALLLVLHAIVVFGATYALSRYGVPLRPVLAIAAAGVLTAPMTALRRLGTLGWRSPGAVLFALLLLGLIAVWCHDLPLVRDMLTTGGVNHAFSTGPIGPSR